MESKYQVQSVLKAIDIIEYLAAAGGSGRLSDIARATNCSKNTAFRLLQTLQARDLIRQNSNASYELTYKLLTLGESILRTTEVQDVARPYIQDLSNQCRETTALAALDGDKIVYLDRHLGNSHFTTTYSIGSRAKVYSTALGKAILAFSPEEIMDNIIQNGLEPNTEFTITDPEKLRVELREIAKRGYAIDNQENVLGIRCIGAPIFSRKGDPIAAISIASLSIRMTDERLNQLSNVLLDTADAISARLGFTSVGEAKRIPNPVM